jgi:hypothetical protein
MSLKDFLDPVVNWFTQQTLPTINRKLFFMISFASSAFAHRNYTTEHFSSAVCFSSMVAISTTETSL